MIVAALGFAVSVLAAEVMGKPNIIVIIADDLGYHDVGFQGATKIKTPHLDRLAAGGAICSDGHVTASVCSPSRAGLMTGRYQQRFGHEANVPPRPLGLDTGERTLGQAMQALGYRTAAFGKWHLGDEKPQHPNARGFDEFWGFREGGRSYWFNLKRDAGKADNPQAVEHNGTPVTFTGHLTDCLGDQAVNFINQNHDRPFFIYLAFNAPHAPFESKPEDKAALDGGNDYEGLVFGLDRNVGKVIAALEQGKIRDNTLIWFLSDNGGVAKQASNAPLGGKKGTKFEGGQRVPFVVSWPARIKPGSKYKPMVSSLDIYPTSVMAGGGKLEQPRPLDGVDVMPFLTGQNSGAPHEKLFWRKLECAAMRDGKWKLIRVDKLGCALYDLDADINESNNLDAKMPDKVEDMKKQLAAWEQDKVKPLWGEEKKWTKWRHEFHAKRFNMKPGEDPDAPAETNE
jgi:arylsulfatase A-like enzyme